MLPGPEALSELVGTLYHAAADPALWPRFLQKLGSSTGATSAAVVMHDFAHASCTVSGYWQLDADLNQLYQEHYHALDIWARRAAAKPNKHVCTSESFCSLKELKKTEIYNDFYVRIGIEHGIFALVKRSNTPLVSLSLYRDKSRDEFACADLGILQFLISHLQSTCDLHLHFSELQSQAAGLGAALDMLPTGVVLLGPKGEVVLMNRSASAFIAEHDGLRAIREGLRAELLTESFLLEETIRRAASTLSGKGLSAGGTVIVSRRERPPLQVQISPIRNLIMNLPKRIAAVAFITDPMQKVGRAQEVLQTLYGLTRAERRVAMLLLDGQTPKEIAGMVGVTVATVRSQIGSIFGKTGVKRQSDLIRLLLNNAVGIRVS
jgi:DNA-binding CsgD family transcriptional regulator